MKNHSKLKHLYQVIIYLNILGLLEKDPNKRLNIKQVLDHNWFKIFENYLYVDKKIECYSDSCLKENNK